MVASTSDMFKKVGDATVTTLAAPGKAIGATSITVGSTTNYPTDTGVVVAIRVVDTSGELVAGTYTEFSGTVTSGTTIGIVAAPVYGSDQVYAAGSTTQVYIGLSKYAHNTLVDGLLVGHEQDGTHKASLPLTTPRITTSINDANGNEAIRIPATASAINDVTVTNAATGVAPSISATGGDAAVDLNLRGKGLAKTVTIGAGATTIYPFDFVSSGLVWSGDAYGSTRAASMTSGVVVINGNPITVASVTGRLFTASRDTYIDVLDAGDGTGTVVYTEVTNNAASPALAANSIRVGIIVTGASNIANVGSVNQGQEDKLLPITSNNPYAVTDSLGNLICPRDPQRKVLGQRRITSNFSISSATSTLVSNAGGTLSVPVIVPTGRKIIVTARGQYQSYATATGSSYLTIHDTSVGGTAIDNTAATSATANAVLPAIVVTPAFTPTTSSKTYVAGLRGDSGAVVSLLGANAYIRVELV